MPRIVLLNGSPSDPSTTESLLVHVAERLIRWRHAATLLNIRTLPCEALMLGSTSDPDLAEAVHTVTSADALVVGTPVYQASYSGLLKSFCDVLPVGALRGVPVLPLLTGGSESHVLALDHGLKPLLSTLGATSIAAGRFVKSAHIHPQEIDAAVVEKVEATVTAFAEDIAVRYRTPAPSVARQVVRPRQGLTPAIG